MKPNVFQREIVDDQEWKEFRKILPRTRTKLRTAIEK